MEMDMEAPKGGTEAQNNGQPYRCFLVRCRLEEGAGSDGAASWRITVQQAGADAARRLFACPHAVAAYLEAELASTAAFAEVKPEDDLSQSAHAPRGGSMNAQVRPEPGSVA
jgi:hypothetical protein